MSIPEDHERPETGAPLPPAQRAPRRTHLPTLLVLMIGLLVLLAVPYLAQQISYSITRGEELAKYDAARQELENTPDSVSRYRLAAKVIEPSVVGIDTVRRVAAPAVADEWMFVPRREQLEALGQGSGVIIDASGYILTNSHVVSQASEVVVRLSDGRIIKDVQLVGADPVSDLAVLKINTGNLTAAKWGNSDDLEVGDQVLAVGNPYGLARSVTAGIVSAKDRRVDVENAGYRDFLQTDAAVNPGNSGGPLVDMRGEVVGLNTAIVGHSYRGISFAIPSQLAKRVFERLTTTGIARGWLGVQMQDVDESLARQFNLEKAGGVVISQVVPGSPAAAAGLQAGDVILAVNDQEIRDSEDLRLVVARAKIGAKLDVKVIRDGQPETISVTIQQRPAQFAPR